MRWWLLVVALASACVDSDSVNCGDRTCPQGSKCDDAHSLCVSKDQASACAQLADGDQCHAMDIDATGICDQTYCVPGCGDGVTQDPNAVGLVEECDDGNFQSHDGCSSVCSAETPVWLELPPQWQGRYSHVAAYMNNLDKHVLLGGVDILRGKPGDMWERDTNGKWTQTTNVQVAPRIGGVMAYDSARGRLVLYGGSDGSQLLGDTWEYDGTTWTMVPAVNPPPPRTFAGMVFDSTRNKMIMFGGQLAGNAFSAETWEYDGPTATWTMITTTGAIPPRRQHAMAYDSARQRVVVFGGVSSALHSDTWDYNPATATWIQNNTAVHPSGRFGSAMTFQAATRNKSVLFGGEVFIGQAIEYADQWEYDGSTWTEYTTTARPPGRYAAVLTTGANGSLALVGGAAGGDITPRADVWAFSSSGLWKDVSPEFPQPREAPMTYDRNHAQLILFGGDFAGTVADTWAFDGLRWQDVTPPPTATSPPWRQFHAMAYDSKRDRVVMFGGERGSPRTRANDTWEWNGTTQTWSQFMGTAPPARIDASFTYDEKIAAIVLFGGVDGPTAYNDTWELDGTGWTQQSQAGGPPARMNRATMAYDPVHERTLLFDTDGKTWTYVDHKWSLLATTDDPPSGQDHVNLTFDPDRHTMTLFGTSSRVWELDGDQWHRVLTVGTVPPSRYNPAFAGHAKARRLVLFGGGAAGGLIGDSWLFGYRSGREVPDEVCDDGMDNDNDKHVDAADPDCANQ